MEQEGQVGLYRVGLGAAAEDRKRNSRIIRVYSSEILPFHGGELKDNTRDESYTTSDKQSGKVQTTNVIEADWLGVSTNNAYPPFIVKGEQVQLYKYHGEDKFYWKELGRDDNLRKTEILRHQISGSSESKSSLTNENTYFHEMNSIDGKIHIHTSKVNGEKTSYDILADGKNGSLSISDSNSNTITLDSVNNAIILSAGGSMISIGKDGIKLISSSDIIQKSPSNLIQNAKVITGGGSTSVTVTDLRDYIRQNSR